MPASLRHAFTAAPYLQELRPKFFGGESFRRNQATGVSLWSHVSGRKPDLGFLTLAIAKAGTNPVKQVAVFLSQTVDPRAMNFFQDLIC